MFRTLATGLVACALCLQSLPALADIQLPRLLADGVVLQRDKPLTLWGTADPGETVTLTLDGQPLAEVSADSEGHWQVSGAQQQAGGPHTITLAGKNQLTLKDVYFGDVWLAAGQSNMEMKVANVKEKYAEIIAASANPEIRQFVIPKAVDYSGPQTDVAAGDWQAANPENLLNYSAVAYFFARDIHAKTQVPVGIINASYGGSAAQAWMSLDALKAFPHYHAQALDNAAPGHVAEAKAADQARANAWYGEIHKRDKGLHDSKPWYDPSVDTRDWKTIELPNTWVSQGLPDLSGVVWLKKTIELPAGLAGKPAMLRLGRIVDADTAYINGEQVGNTTYTYPQRRYQVPAGLLKAGSNTLVVRAVTNAGKGELVKDKPYRLEVGDHTVELAGSWQARVGTEYTPQPATEFWDFQQPVGMYNAMLAPVLKMPLKGVIWYQGESNVSAAAEYARLQPAMIRLWRRDFGQPLPFIYVQLPGFGPIQEQPTESGWAEMRDAQTHALAEPATAMAVAIDLGDWNDIHPLNKKDVGERLALAARKVAYGESKLAAESPAAYMMSIEEDKALISIAHAYKGLTSQGKPGGFAIAGADGKYVWAEAKLDKNSILVWSDAVKEPVSVRYAWADYPERANVYSGVGLPLTPFSITLDIPAAPARAEKAW